MEVRKIPKVLPLKRRHQEVVWGAVFGPGYFLVNVLWSMHAQAEGDVCAMCGLHADGLGPYISAFDAGPPNTELETAVGDCRRWWKR